MLKFDEAHRKSLKDVDSIVYSLRNNRWYYDADFECKYTPFEEDIKKYCDSYCEVYISNNEAGLFFNNLTHIVDAIVECDAEMYDEDFFRPAELITYYFGKIITSDDGLKDRVHDWISGFCRRNEDDMIEADYFTPFIKGEKIYHADNQYTGYDDLNRMLGAFK